MDFPCFERVLHDLHARRSTPVVISLARAKRRKKRHRTAQALQKTNRILAR